MSDWYSRLDVCMVANWTRDHHETFGFKWWLLGCIVFGNFQILVKNIQKRWCLLSYSWIPAREDIESDIALVVLRGTTLNQHEPTRTNMNHPYWRATPRGIWGSSPVQHRRRSAASFPPETEKASQSALTRREFPAHSPGVPGPRYGDHQPTNG